MTFVRATADEQARSLPGDNLLTERPTLFYDTRDDGQASSAGRAGMGRADGSGEPRREVFGRFSRQPSPPERQPNSAELQHLSVGPRRFGTRS
jgi:hypothetical protein